ncbi:MAG: hypothetical protein EBT52_08140, partial [Flavobacteriia bacterium]|nr:hypothetical protein [Flavobacteriia bacterium]
MSKNVLIFSLIALLWTPLLRAQSIDIIPGIEYEIGGIEVQGSGNLDNSVIVLLSGLQVGEKVTFPSEKIQSAVRKLWRQKLFNDVSLAVTRKIGNTVFLEIRLQELPKLSKYGIFGIKKSKRDNIREEINLSRGLIVTENLKTNTINKIKRYYRDKGYLNATANIESVVDTSVNNAVLLNIFIEP